MTHTRRTHPPGRPTMGKRPAENTLQPTLKKYFKRTIQRPHETIIEEIHEYTTEGTHHPGEEQEEPQEKQREEEYIKEETDTHVTADKLPEFEIRKGYKVGRHKCDCGKWAKLGPKGFYRWFCYSCSKEAQKKYCTPFLEVKSRNIQLQTEIDTFNDIKDHSGSSKDTAKNLPEFPEQYLQKVYNVGRKKCQCGKSPKYGPNGLYRWFCGQCAIEEQKKYRTPLVHVGSGLCKVCNKKRCHYGHKGENTRPECCVDCGKSQGMVIICTKPIFSRLVACATLSTQRRRRNPVYVDTSPEFRDHIESIAFKPCYYCHEKVDLSFFPRHTQSYRIDRVDNTKGYIFGNVVPCCDRCNKAKSDLSVSDFEEYREDIRYALQNNSPRPGIKDKEKRSQSSLDLLIRTTQTYAPSSKKKKGMEVTLTADQIELLYFGSCAYCKLPISRGIDRVDPSKGYTPENCVSCCMRCNRFKNDMTLEEFYAWVQRV